MRFSHRKMQQNLLFQNMYVFLKKVQVFTDLLMEISVSLPCFPEFFDFFPNFHFDIESQSS